MGKFIAAVLPFVIYFFEYSIPFPPGWRWSGTHDDFVLLDFYGMWNFYRWTIRLLPIWPVDYIPPFPANPKMPLWYAWQSRSNLSFTRVSPLFLQGRNTLLQLIFFFLFKYIWKVFFPLIKGVFFLLTFWGY